MTFRVILLTVFALVAPGCVDATTNQTATPPPEVTPALVSTSYKQSLENFPNPERGFAFQNDVPWPAQTSWGFCAQDENFAKYDYIAWNDPLNLEFLQRERAQGRSVVQSRYHIADFRNRDLTPQYLEFLQRDFEVSRQAGVKLAVRFAYNYPNGGPDAPLAVILRHIQQLRPLLTKNADVIAFLEAGFVGCWGEWHHSSNGLSGEGTTLDGYVTPSERQILDALLAAVPPERMIAMRYPRQKFDYFGSKDWLPITPLTADTAFNGSSRARIGHQDDCFVCSPSHGFAYNNPRGDLSEVPRFLEKENLFVVQTGEPGSPETIDPSVPGNSSSPLASCETVLQELSRIRWSVIGLFDLGSKTAVIDRWKRDGCHDEIARRLGYRYRLLTAEIPLQATRGKTLVGNLFIANDGFANLYNPRLLELVLRSSATGKVTRLNIFDDARLKLPFPGQTKKLNFKLNLPQTLEPGKYDVLLALPDPMPKLYDRSEYAIRLANQNVWEANTGFNNLGQSLEVQP